MSSTAEKKILLHSDVMLRFFMETLLAIRISLLKTSETTIACRLLDLSTPPLLLLRMQAYRCYYRGRQNDCYISSPPSHYVLAPPFPPRFFHSSRQLHSSAIIFGHLGDSFATIVRKNGRGGAGNLPLWPNSFQ